MTANPYCESLGITPPRPEDFIGNGQVKLFHLMVAAILEHGRPMALDDLTDRLSRAGAVSPIGNLRLSVQKAWHGKAPIYKDDAGRYGLDLDSSELRWILRIDLKLIETPKVDVPPPPAVVVPADDSTPLTPAEVRAALEGGHLGNLAVARLAAAILEAAGRPLTVAEVDGLLYLNLHSPRLQQTRKQIREMAKKALEEQARRRHWQEQQAQREALQATAFSKLAAEAKQWRRTILQPFPEAGPVRALALVDVGSREIHTFVGDEIASIPGVLNGYDVLVGLNIRSTIERLGLDAMTWRIADLRPPQKTRRINRSGRTLTITTEMIIQATIGIARPLGDPAKMADYWKTQQFGKMRRRLASDVKSLAALYAYGILHGAVRLRWGFLDDALPVDWDTPADAFLYDYLKEAAETGVQVDVVLGSAPGWEEPWSRAVRLTVAEVDRWGFSGFNGTHLVNVDRWEVAAIRMVDGQVPARRHGIWQWT